MSPIGVRGPIPKRSGTRLRNESVARAEGHNVTRAPGAKRVFAPAADPDWHPIAARLYASLKKSGQSAFYEPSDWAMAYSLCEDLSAYKRMDRRSGQMLAVIYSTLSTLLVTEGDRRRAQMELEREDSSESKQTTVIDAYEKLLESTAA